jgi:hypothetical protein
MRGMISPHTVYCDTNRLFACHKLITRLTRLYYQALADFGSLLLVKDKDIPKP